MHKTKSGFTIVELLIVIVIIAILAAITIVAYNGIQNRANDTTVQSDLKANAKTLLMYKVDNDTWPTPVQARDYTTRLKFSKGSYMTTNNAALYCRSVDGSQMSLIGKSKSGKTYYINTTNSTPVEFTATFPSGTTIDCPNSSVDVTSTTTTGGWVHAVGAGWAGWVD